ncbi:DUF2271 domain-containing protein [Paenibacillus beijingensis]|uniref:DUF2271 domain-containing protein n=1 Tax=Paenibacillus beijingensis TaxID=1126833 RepID=A0A0D5NH49_9BACL|nr:DUF2271 domain-containing protein [Paenibacillus beijingensis]AJY74699.1 hypothetical protein VN24_09020 [Paenibacillus beijingensis]
MKKVLIPVVGTVGAGVIIISGMSNFAYTDNPFSASPSPSGIAASAHETAGTSSGIPEVKTLGLVDIRYQLNHLNQLASNQIAIWIEDQSGNYVTTLRASSFTAGGGYRKRPESLPEWRKAANWEQASEAEIERVSLPQQEPGEHVLYWNCTDDSGRAVEPGTYVYKVEGNIFWENRVLYTGEIAVGTDPSESTANADYIPASAESEGTLLEHVSSVFKPGVSIASVDQEPLTVTRGS